MYISNCKTNHFSNPLGYLIETPTFSYTVEDAKGKHQTEARLIVSLTADMNSIVYDSGFRSDIDSLAFAASFSLQPRTRYYWTITVRTDAYEEATSDLNWFETAKQDESWIGKWITCDSTTGRHPIFQKSFLIKKKITSARFYICGLGLYELHINNRKVGNELLTPYCNNYTSWLQYQTYDVTEYLDDENDIAVLMGNGWYKGRYGVDSVELPAERQPSWKLIGELHVTYEDGSADIFGTDKQWQVGRSNIIFSSIYDGEIRDDTLADAEPVGAHLFTEELPPLTARLSTPVTIHKDWQPIELIQTPKGELVLDLGQNFSGIFSLSVHEPAGTRIHLQFGEVLQGGNFYRDNLRSAKAEYIYISDGQSHVLKPHFTFYGYRYVKIDGITNLKRDDFVGHAVYSSVPEAGHLTTGNPLINQLIHNARWGLYSNFIDIPTDCPQRDERMGWTGDAQAFAPTACFLTDSYAFYRKYLADMATEQAQAGGIVPNVVPSFGDRSTSSVWGDAVCIIPWHLYQFYGDVSILAERFGDMKAWVDYISKTDEGTGKWRDHFHWGDWLALDNPAGGDSQVFGGTDAGFIADVYYMNSAEIVAKTAKLLNNSAEEQKYTRLSAAIRERILDEYYSPNGRCCIPTQTAYLLTLKNRLSVDEQKARRVLRTLFSQKNDSLQTGFVGTPILCNVLSDYGMTDLAYKLLFNEEFPSWIYAVKMGATTIWERWNSINPDGSISSTGMNSLNHYAYGSIVEWIWRHAAGITPAEGGQGFRKVHFQPSIHEKLGFAEGIYHSPAGTWRMKWSIKDNAHLHIQMTVPFGCEATIQLPFASDDLHASVDNPIFNHTENGTCHLTAGTYEIEYETTCPLYSHLSTNSTIGELQASPEAVEILSASLPGFDSLPVDLATHALRPFMLQYGGMSGVTEELLNSLDTRLAEIQQQAQNTGTAGT